MVNPEASNNMNNIEFLNWIHDILLNKQVWLLNSERPIGSSSTKLEREIASVDTWLQ